LGQQILEVHREARLLNPELVLGMLTNHKVEMIYINLKDAQESNYKDFEFEMARTKLMPLSDGILCTFTLGYQPHFLTFQPHV
jgi:hypothetical protein